MKLDFIELDEKVLDAGLNQLSDTIKIWLYESNSNIFNDFNFDSLYLEPHLFYLLSKNKNSPLPLQYILSKYVNREKELLFDLIEMTHDSYYIPGFGITQNVKDKKLIFKEGLFYDTNGENVKLESEIKIAGSNINICSFVPSILKNYIKEVPLQSIYENIQNSIPDIESAWKNITNFSPNLGNAINKTTKEISVSNFPDMPSFASINHFGTSFINIYDQNPTDIYFMDEIAHQSGHTLFYLFTLNRNDFFKCPSNTPIKEFTGVSYDTRVVYGCFHSMFTLCTIIHSLNNYLSKSKGEFEKDKRNELIGRISFYLEKLLFDIDNLSNCNIFTDEGVVYYNMFIKNSLYYSNLYDGLFKKFSFENQHYYFNLDTFNAENQNPINEKNILI
ncbi:MAG: hypothetical protein LBF15_06875 [Candidatus Peribacteria bacterium]|jgi:hypothetical protein|nr:hypothetical protein [Candidatus Peribacteria bacterium]